MACSCAAVPLHAVFCMYLYVTERPVGAPAGLFGWRWRFLPLISALAVKAGVPVVEVLLPQPVLHECQAFSKTLKVYDLPGPEELDDVVDIGIVAQAQDVVIGDPCLLFCCNRVRTTCVMRWYLDFCSFYTVYHSFFVLPTTATTGNNGRIPEKTRFLWMQK